MEKYTFVPIPALPDKQIQGKKSKVNYYCYSIVVFLRVPSSLEFQVRH